MAIILSLFPPGRQVDSGFYLRLPRPGRFSEFQAHAKTGGLLSTERRREVISLDTFGSMAGTGGVNLLYTSRTVGRCRATVCDTTSRLRVLHKSARHRGHRRGRCVDANKLAYHCSFADTRAQTTRGEVFDISPPHVTISQWHVHKSNYQSRRADYSEWLTRCYCNVQTVATKVMPVKTSRDTVVYTENNNKNGRHSYEAQSIIHLNSRRMQLPTICSHKSSGIPRAHLWKAERQAKRLMRSQRCRKVREKHLDVFI
ncbi:hypothetical protein DFH11DRAFT_704329 [Phellopilus nigrolimitatus]|nr:hypothetical protein DFH11DRAFT_704329 [Phellopilus nigrolimitatus]